MTTRERNLLVVVGVVIVFGLIYYYLINRAPNTESVGASVFTYDEAYRLLKKTRNIVNQNQVVAEKLDAMEARFFSLEDPNEAENKLLREVETIAAASHLMVESKTPNLRLPNNLIGVLLAGKSSPDSIYLFLQKTTESKIALKINKLQLHSNEEQKLVDFQIVIVSLLIEKRKK